MGTRVCANLALAPPSSTSGTGRWGVFYCVRIVAKPFFDVRGGDVAAGGAFTAGGVCGPGNAQAAIASWPNAPGFNAAGTQYGAFALGRITGFASAQVRRNLAQPPTVLSFSNSPSHVSGLYNASTNASSETYGGSFGSVPCIDDHWSGLPSSAVSTAGNVGVLARGSYMYNTATLNGATIATGRQVVIYRDGDLRIGGDIRYNRSVPWANTAAIPAFKVVVRGNIYIDRNVSQLDGIYVAQPDAGGIGGNIYTCANGVTPVNLSANNAYDTCDTPLTVNGVFSAKRVHLLRTNGTAANGQFAERFNFLPEIWQARWPASANETKKTYDAITGLPPVL